MMNENDFKCEEIQNFPCPWDILKCFGGRRHQVLHLIYELDKSGVRWWGARDKKYHQISNFFAHSEIQS